LKAEIALGKEAGVEPGARCLKNERRLSSSAEHSKK